MCSKITDGILPRKFDSHQVRIHYSFPCLLQHTEHLQHTGVLIVLLWHGFFLIITAGDLTVVNRKKRNWVLCCRKFFAFLSEKSFGCGDKDFSLPNKLVRIRKS